MLSSAVVQVSGVQVDSQQNWRKFAFGMSWKLPGMARFAEDLGAAVAFEAFRGQEYVGFGVDAASQPESPGARELRRELVNSKVSIEIRLGQQSRLVPVAFKVSHFDTRWADDCSKHYVSGGTGDRDLLLDKTGWCLLQQGDSTLQDEVKKAATLWLRPDAVSGAVGPTMSWHVRWPDGTTVRAPAVTQYVAHK